MHDAIKDIQNTLWMMYKDISTSGDMTAYNRQAKELVNKYSDYDDMCRFCQNMIITWAPVINSIHGEKKE